MIILGTYDTFPLGLYRPIAELEEPPIVLRNDAVTLSELRSAETGGSPASSCPADPAMRGSFANCREASLPVVPGRGWPGAVIPKRKRARAIVQGRVSPGVGRRRQRARSTAAAERSRPR